MAANRRRRGGIARQAEEAFQAGLQQVYEHPLFRPMAHRVHVLRRKGNRCPHDGWLVAFQSGRLECHAERLAEPAEWAFVIGTGYLHFALAHFEDLTEPALWQRAAELSAARFLSDLRIGRPPGGQTIPKAPSGRDAPGIYRQLVSGGGTSLVDTLPLSGSAAGLILDGEAEDWHGTKVDWAQLFAMGLRDAVEGAVEVAGGRRSHLAARPTERTVFEHARDWFVSSFPLLGALARHFDIIDDPVVCNRLDIGVAAVDEVAEEIYVNRGAGLDYEQACFVIAHELLHVGLRHFDRRQGRDPFLWNVACDFVINAWLIEMRVGAPPSMGLLHDPDLAGMSAEEIYDQITKNLRVQRRLATLRGRGLGDMLDPGTRRPRRGTFSDLDAFYRSCLARGLDLHLAQNRGLLPAGLVEEIRALQQPPVPWDVQLARWFEEWFPSLEARRTYARPSRRQASTPDIPRPRYHVPEEQRDGRTFGVVLDTSGSMDRQLLGKALGAIASYADRHDVRAVRVVFCDAHPYDAGYMPPDQIAGRVKVRGRGGTILQPGIHMLEQARDFPDDGPILLITDGWCDVLRIRHEHAFLLPRGHRLPFRTRAPVFEFE